MRNYELVCIAQPDLDETAFNEVVENVKGWITEAGGDGRKSGCMGQAQACLPDPQTARRPVCAV